MSTTTDLLADLTGRGIELWAEGGRLRFRPAAAMTPELAERVKAHKGELLAAVRKREALDRRIAEQLAQLVPYKTADGRRGWVHPRYRGELERLGLL